MRERAMFALDGQQLALAMLKDYATLALVESFRCCWCGSVQHEPQACAKRGDGASAWRVAKERSARLLPTPESAEKLQAALAELMAR